jgi:hypothetical protein
MSSTVKIGDLDTNIGRPKNRWRFTTMVKDLDQAKNSSKKGLNPTKGRNLAIFGSI